MLHMRTALYAKPLAAYLIVALVTLSSLAGPAEAMLLPAENAVSAAAPAAADRATDLTTVRSALESKILSQRLQDYGLSSEEALARINSLSDEQVHQLASNLQSVQAGGDAVGTLFALVVIAALVVLIIFLLEGRIEIRHR